MMDLASKSLPTRHNNSVATQCVTTLYCIARAKGLEPSTSSVTGKRSNQLSYARVPIRLAYYRANSCLLQPKLYSLSLWNLLMCSTLLVFVWKYLCNSKENKGSNNYNEYMLEGLPVFTCHTHHMRKQIYRNNIECCTR